MKTFLQQFGHGQTERANTSDLARLNTDVTRLLQKHETPGNPNVNGQQTGSNLDGEDGKVRIITLAAAPGGTLNYGSSASGTKDIDGTTVTVYSGLLSTGQSVTGGLKVAAVNEGGTWKLITATCP